MTRWGTPVMHRPQQQVAVFDEALRALAADMVATMYAADGVGLAACQVGEDVAMFVFDCPDATGRRTVGWQHPKLLPALLSDRGNGRDAYVKSSADFWDVIGSPSYPQERDRVESRAGETFDRGVSRSGIMRHMMAVLTQPNRSARLHAVRVPTLVVHGTSDLMVHVSGGRATAAAVPGSELLLVDGMGHDLPEQLWGTVIDAIEREISQQHARRRPRK